MKAKKFFLCYYSFMDFIKKNFFFLILILTGLFGICLRFYVYLTAPSLWFDEVCLVENVDKLIFFPPLLFNQSAPPLFLALTKIISILNYSDFSFRFLPFLASILSIPIFYFFLKEFISSKTGKILALFMFGLNFQLLFYSTEFKPYALDVLVFMALTLFFFKIDFNKISKLKSFVLGFLFALCPLISFPSLFVLPACIIFSFLNKNFKKGALFSLPVALLPLVYYFTFLKNYNANDYLMTFWKDGFITLNSFLPCFMKLFDWFMFPLNLNIFALLIFIIGLVLILKERNKKVFFLIFSVFCVILASVLHKYPFEERLTLFLLPLFLTILFKPFDFKGKKKIFAIILSLLAFGSYILSDLSHVSNEQNFEKEPIKNFLETIKKENDEKATIFPLPWSNRAFNYYNKFYNFKNVLIIEDNNRENYTEPFKNIKKGRYYLIFTMQSDNYLRYKALTEWLDNDFKTLKVYKDGNSRMFYVEKLK